MIVTRTYRKGGNKIVRTCNGKRRGTHGSNSEGDGREEKERRTEAEMNGQWTRAEKEGTIE